MPEHSYDPSDIEAVVYDLDGTLVRLDVDWAVVRQKIFDALGNDDSLTWEWGILDIADERGKGDEVRDIINSHECEGARNSELLPYAERLRDDGVPTAICSLNCEEACRIALEKHGLIQHV
ncbi:MAG: HAD family hydrolase, partial [Halobacteria archaeon]|nr:HAD family hydrolase [Halobacteria archaeon]